MNNATAELHRIEAERVRVKAEEARVEAEHERLVAEQGRVAAERVRHKAVESVVDAAAALTTSLEQMQTVEEMRRALRAVADFGKLESN